MRRDLSRLSTSLKLFTRHPYSRSSKASNPRSPEVADRQRSRQEGGLQSLFRRCRTWRGISNSHSPSAHVIGVRLQNKGLRAQAGDPGFAGFGRAGRPRGFGSAAKPGLERFRGRFQSLLDIQSTITYLSYFMSRLCRLLNGPLCFLSTSGDRASE